MLTLFKSLVLPWLDYASQVWSPYLLKHIYLIEKVQRAKHIPGIRDLSYSTHLEKLNCIHYKEGERYIALHMCGKLLND